MGNPNDWNQKVIEEFRANGGKVGGMFEGTPLVLLHTIGAKSQQERINPVACLLDGDRYVVFASKAGAPTNPDWYYNLVAQPLVTVEFGTEQFQARAAVADEPERTQLYNRMAVGRPNFVEYEQKTTRKIPVVILTRV
jgi:deazaflavin-dependent oxidoreductase (nitroreductase family)